MMEELQLKDCSPDYEIGIKDEGENIVILITSQRSSNMGGYEYALLPKEEVPKLFKWLLQWLVENYK